MTPPLRRSPRLAFAASAADALGFGASQAWAAGAARHPCDFAWYGTCHSQAECAAVCESVGGAGSWSYCDGRDCCQCEFLFAFAVAASLGFGGRAAAAAPRTECQSTYAGFPAYCSPRFDCDAACDAATGTPDAYGFCSARGGCICISAGVG